MLNNSIRNQLLGLAAIALLVLIAFAGIVNAKFNRIHTNKLIITSASEALRDQMEADMMHLLFIRIYLR